MPLQAKEGEDPDFELTPKKKETKEKVSVTPVFEEEDIMGMLLAQSIGDENEDENESEQFSKSTKQISVKEKLDFLVKKNKSNEGCNEGGSPSKFKVRAAKLYKRHAIPRPDSPDIVIPNIEREGTPPSYGKRQKRPSYEFTTPPRIVSPERPVSPFDVFDEARLIKANNPLDVMNTPEKAVHPKKRLKLDRTPQYYQTRSPFGKLIPKKLVIPCLKPASQFKDPPKAIEFYNKRQTINQSRQKSYVIMSVAYSASKKKYLYHEIESVISYKKDKTSGEIKFLVKWRSFGNKYNTWEPHSHFISSPEILLDYIRSVNKDFKKLPEELTTIKLLLKRRVKKLHQQSSMEYVWQLNAELSLNLIKQRYRKLLKQYSQKVKDELGPSFPDVEVQNNIDFNLPPLNFTFVRDRFAGRGVHISDDTLIGCVCAGEWGTENCCLGQDKQCCPHLGGANSPYNKKGRLILKPGLPIYECNARCSCGPDCGNRIIQRGPQIRTAIFKTPDKGWGLKTLEAIPKGGFVVEYVGEVINFTEAEKRGQEYDSQGLTYLFDLDYSQSHEEAGEGMFTLDAAFYGNTSHFINHSCDPNLAVYSCWVQNLDIRLPHICLFAIRNIAAGEELSFNYRIDRIPHDDGSRSYQVLSVECKCGSKNCVRFLHG